MKQPITAAIIMLIFFTFGLVAMGFGIYFGLDNLAFKKSAIEITGRITDIESRRGDKGTLYTPVASFQLPSGEEITVHSRVSSSYSPFNIGDPVPILYDPAKPSNARLATLGNQWLPTLFFIPFGFLFALVGGYYFYYRLQIRRRQDWLQRHGTTITAQSDGVIVGAFKLGRGDNSESYQIKAQWLNPSDQKVYRFTSDYLWYDPTNFINNGVKVLIDPTNPKYYWVDTSALPSAA